MFKVIRGTRDILPKEFKIWQEIENKSKTVFELFGYRRIETPIIEDKGLFLRSLGQDSEVVQKQMFIITKNEFEEIALRPEGTAGTIRAYIENQIAKTSGFAKLYYTGPMFRAERPQKGRLREFHHIGAEAIGSYSPYLDAEVIKLCDTLLKEFGISGHKIRINSLGCKEDKIKLNGFLKNKLANSLKKLCPDCQYRYNRNVLRILDCKNPECVKVIKDLKLTENDYLCPDCANNYKIVCEALNISGVNYDKDSFLVRGLDYYTQTVFEITHDNLGSQDAIGAGGRYNNLTQDLGGEPTGAVGFALGVERLLIVIGDRLTSPQKDLSYIITLGEDSLKKGIELLNLLRSNGIPADTDYENKSLKAAMRKANDLNAKFVIIIGENELKENCVTLKNMDSGEQKKVGIEDLVPVITNPTTKNTNI